MAGSRIRVLEPEVAEKVAAGEVIQRPADVVKELLENAIDAEPRHVSIEIKGGGLELIKVVDDGCGISAAELEVACARHGTSKLREVDDLGRVRTLGFRGEALPSIGTVAELTVVSRPADAGAGAYLVMDGGKVRERGARGCPTGTQVTVKRLFHNLPARLAFQRSAGGEGAHIAHMVGLYALAYPELRLSLTVDGRRALDVGGGDRREVMSGVYGLEAAVSMVELEANDPAGVSVSGLISPPDLTRGSRGDVLLYANRRPIQNRSLTHAIVDAYRGFLPEARYPLVVLDVQVAPDEIDVNVHPSKTEVRFKRDRLVYAAVQRAIRSTLLQTAPPPAFSAPLRAAGSVVSPSGPPAWLTAPSRAGAAVVAAGGGAAAASAPWTGTAPRDGAGEAVQADAHGAAGGTRLPILRIVGQVQSTYIVCEGPDGVYFVDQHAAHERILYEQVLAEKAEGGVARQQLLVPLVVEVPARVSAQVGELAPFGFEAEPFGERSVLVRAVPSGLTRGDPARALLELLEALANPTPTADGLDRAAATVACHSAVRAGDPLSPDLMRRLIEQLESTDVGRFCPHGRPTVVRLPSTQLERDFGRR